MKRNKLLALLLSAVLLLSLLAGCGGKPTGNPGPTKDPGPGTQETRKPAAPVELNVVTSYGGDNGNRKNYENAVKAYEEATGNKILDASASSNEEWKAKVLEDCGVAVPGLDYTWDQFLKDCQAIKDKGYTPIACSLFEVPHYWFEFCVMNNGTLASQLDVPKAAGDAAGKKWAAALNDIKDLYEKGFFPVNTLTATDAETVQLFGDGEAAFLIDGSWKVTHFVDNYLEHLEEFAISYVPAKGERKASEAIGGISMGYFITRKAWDNPAKRAAAVEFIMHMTSDEVMSSFVTTEVTALKNGASPSGLNPLQQSAAANANITGVIGAVQDTISGEAKTDLFGNVQNVVTGAMTAEEAVASAIALN